MSHCLQKFARKNKKKIVILSCHYDVLEWLIPDWLIDCNEQKFYLRSGEDFFFKRREKIEFEIRPCTRDSWKYFSKYHYLSEAIPSGVSRYYGLYHGLKQIGFQAFSNYVPKVKGRPYILHFNRTVVHPDYNGLGIGIELINKSTELLLKENPGFRIMGKFSSVPVYRAMIRDKHWKFLGAHRKMGLMNHGKGTRPNHRL